MTDRDLGQALTALGSQIEVPDVDLVEGVHAALEASTSDGRRYRTLQLAAAAALVLVVAVSVLVAPVRGAVADLLGIGGTKVEIVDELPPAEPPELPASSEASLDDAVAGLGFEAALPDPATTGPVLAWEVRGTGDAEELIVVYDGLVFSQRALGEDSVVNRKVLDPQATVEPVTVDGEPGIWIEGTHVRIRDENAETATNALVWERAGLELRLEGAPDLDTALTIARSVE